MFTVSACRVSYKRDAPTNILSLNIPMDAAANKDQVEEYQVQSTVLKAGFLKLNTFSSDGFLRRRTRYHTVSFISCYRAFPESNG
jgi:hypothetical protein